MCICICIPTYIHTYQISGNDMMSGFWNQLKSATVSVKSVLGVPKPNYRCVKSLRATVTLTAKVIRVMNEAEL